MKSFKNAVRNFVSNEDGAALVEYALLVALIAIVCILGVTALGDKVNNKFTETTTELENAGKTKE